MTSPRPSLFRRESRTSAPRPSALFIRVDSLKNRDFRSRLGNRFLNRGVTHIRHWQDGGFVELALGT